MTVMMPVRCIGDFCKQCSKLNLEVNRYYAGDSVVSSDICCANIRTCELIKQMVENETNKEEIKNDHQD